MKKLVLVLTISTIIYACGNQEGKKEDAATTTTESATPEAPPAAAEDVTSNPDYLKGLELIGKSDCLTCHKVEEKAIGPAYREVANKYANDEQTVALLADKIIKGGSGVWGPVPMTPHPTISVEDAKQMVKYVLLLKKN